MPFVKLDCGILNSTLWLEREMREIFITALLMAEPFELQEPTEQIQVSSLEFTGWMVPVGWYGFVPAAGIGIIHRAKVPENIGRIALERLGNPEESSRSHDFDGRRMVRVDGGYLILNYMKYRERDYTSAERSKRYRERLASRRDSTPLRRRVTPERVVTRDITQAEAEAYAERRSPLSETIANSDPPPLVPRSSAETENAVTAFSRDFLDFWNLYPKRIGKDRAWAAWQKVRPELSVVIKALAWQVNSDEWNRDNGQYRPSPTRYLDGRRWLDEPPDRATYVPNMNTKEGRTMDALRKSIERRSENQINPFTGQPVITDGKH